MNDRGQSITWLRWEGGVEVGCVEQHWADGSRERELLNFGSSQRLGAERESGRL